MTFSEEIKQRRLEYGMSQKQFAEYLGLSLSTIQNLEIFDGGFYGSYPKYETIKKLQEKGIIDYSYIEVRETIDRDRRMKFRKKK